MGSDTNVSEEAEKVLTEAMLAQLNRYPTQATLENQDTEIRCLVKASLKAYRNLIRSRRKKLGAFSTLFHDPKLLPKDQPEWYLEFSDLRHKAGLEKIEKRVNEIEAWLTEIDNDQ